MAEKKDYTEEDRLLISARMENDNEILGKMPSWIIRYGMLSTACLLLLLITVFLLVTVPSTITIQGNFNTIAEVGENNILSTSGFQAVRETKQKNGRLSDTCFVGVYNFQLNSLKEGQLAKIKFFNGNANFSWNLVLKKIIVDTVKQKAILLFNNIRINDMRNIEGMEIKIGQKSIFQMLF